MATSMVDAPGLSAARFKRPSGENKHQRLNSSLGDDSFESAEEDEDGGGAFQEQRRKKPKSQLRTDPSAETSRSAGTLRINPHTYVYLEATKDIRLQDFAIARKLHSAGVAFLAISSKGIKQLLIRFATKTEATAFTQNEALLNSLQCTANISDPFPDHITGIIRNVDPDISDEEMAAELTAASHYKLIKVSRISRVDENEVKTPTSSVLLKFQGTVLPRSVQMFHVSRKVDLYIPKPTICYNCQIYGHIAKQCKSSFSICGFCAGKHNTRDCDKNRATETPMCANCQGNHLSSSTQCPIMQQKHKNRLENALKLTHFQAPPKISSDSVFPNLVPRSLDAVQPDNVQDYSPPAQTLPRRTQKITVKKFSEALASRQCTDLEKYEQRKFRYQPLLQKIQKPQTPKAQQFNPSPKKQYNHQIPPPHPPLSTTLPTQEFTLDFRTLITQLFTDEQALTMLLGLLKIIITSLPQGDQLDTVNIRQLQSQMRNLYGGVAEMNTEDIISANIEVLDGAH